MAGARRPRRMGRPVRMLLLGVAALAFMSSVPTAAAAEPLGRRRRMERRAAEQQHHHRAMQDAAGAGGIVEPVPIPAVPIPPAIGETTTLAGAGAASAPPLPALDEETKQALKDGAVEAIQAADGELVKAATAGEVPVVPVPPVPAVPAVPSTVVTDATTEAAAAEAAAKAAAEAVAKDQGLFFNTVVQPPKPAASGFGSGFASAAASAAAREPVQVVEQGVTTTMIEAAAAVNNATKALSVEDAFEQCMGARLGSEAVASLNISSIVPNARRRLQELVAAEDPQCDVRRTFMLVVNQTMGLGALGGLISQPLLDHNITNFRAMGGAGTGCFIVPLDGCAADELLEDPRIALAVPMEASMKKPIHFDERLNSTVAAIQNATLFAATATDTTAEAIAAAVDAAAATNLSSLADLPGFSLPGSDSDFSYIPTPADIVAGVAAGGVGGVSAAGSRPRRPTDSISFHVTLVDTEGIQEKMEAWTAELGAMGVDVSKMAFSISDSLAELSAATDAATAADGAFSLLDANADVTTSTSTTTTAEASTEGGVGAAGEAFLDVVEDAVDSVIPKVRTRYLVVKNVPPTNASVVSDFLTTQPVVDFVELTPRLLFLTKWARGVTQTADWQQTPLTTLGLDGRGQIIGVADTGMDPRVCFLSDTNTVPYNSISISHRKVVTYITFADNQENTEKGGGTIGHGTHVTSTVVGNSRSRPDMNGLAQAGKVAFFDIAKYDNAGNIQLYPPGDLNSDLFEKLYKAGARVMSMSWGSPDSNCYSSYAVMVDEFMHNNPDALVIFAAGNSGTQGDYSVVTPSTAKSCVTVGASYNVQQSSFGLENNINYVAYFSSAGPTADGRLKPDLVAPGYYITAAKSFTSCDTIQSRGTSMATPVVAGNAALIRQWFMQGSYQGRAFVPNGALLKAMLVHSAQRMTAYEDPSGKLRSIAYPDNHQGYGRIQLDQVIDTKGRYTLLAYGTQDSTDPRFRQVNKQGDAHEYKLRVSNSTKTKPRHLKVTLVWTDRPGSATSCSKTRQSVLSNDLDLVVSGPKGTIFYPLSTQGKGPDRYNPIEQIIVASPLAGGNYTITVTAHSLVTPQNYALVISGQFSGFNYNETTVDILPTIGVWDSFVQALNGNTAGAVLLVLVLCVVGMGLVGCCFRPPRGVRALGSGGNKPGPAGPQGGGSPDSRVPLPGADYVGGSSPASSLASGEGGGSSGNAPPPKPARRSPQPGDYGYNDAARALAYVVPPQNAQDERNKYELFNM